MRHIACIILLFLFIGCASNLVVAPGAKLPAPTSYLQAHDIIGKWKTSTSFPGYTAVLKLNLTRGGNGSYEIYGDNYHTLSVQPGYNYQSPLTWMIIDGNLVLKMKLDPQLTTTGKEKTYILYPEKISLNKIDFSQIVPTNKEATEFFAKYAMNFKRIAE